ncbi:hypothetical protein K438DRAFT_2090909 [Mycena galopus ATCC 62051]|nr:hypothetical protein K438DRAFT_2090909 [Mycena galopus ATCC 62051]
MLRAQCRRSTMRTAELRAAEGRWVFRIVRTSHGISESDHRPTHPLRRIFPKVGTRASFLPSHMPAQIFATVAATTLHSCQRHAHNHQDQRGDTNDHAPSTYPAPTPTFSSPAIVAVHAVVPHAPSTTYSLPPPRTRPPIASYTARRVDTAFYALIWCTRRSRGPAAEAKVTADEHPAPAKAACIAVIVYLTKIAAQKGDHVVKKAGVGLTKLTRLSLEGMCSFAVLAVPSGCESHPQCTHTVTDASIIWRNEEAAQTARTKADEVSTKAAVPDAPSAPPALFYSPLQSHAPLVSDHTKSHGDTGPTTTMKEKFRQIQTGCWG